MTNQNAIKKIVEENVHTLYSTTELLTSYYDGEDLALTGIDKEAMIELHSTQVFIDLQTRFEKGWVEKIKKLGFNAPALIESGELEPLSNEEHEILAAYWDRIIVPAAKTLKVDHLSDVDREFWITLSARAFQMATIALDT